MMAIFIIWIAFFCLEQKKKLESHNKICEKKDFCNVAITSEETKILSLGV